jgi:hypothetical protein
MEKFIRSSRGTKVLVRGGKVSTPVIPQENRKIPEGYFVGKEIVSEGKVEVETPSFTTGKEILNALRADGGQGYISWEMERGTGIKMYTVTQIHRGRKVDISNLGSIS